MNRVTVFAVLAAFIMVWITDCDSNDRNIPNSVELTDEGFPKSMVGIWESQNPKCNWGIKFEEDGSIQKLIHQLAGPVNLREGGVSAEGPEGSYYVFMMGPCTSQYIPSEGIVEVNIKIDHFSISLPYAGSLEGKSEDRIWGPVSKDGKTWQTQWVDYGWIEGADEPDPNLIEANPIPITFKKLDIKKLKSDVHD